MYSMRSRRHVKLHRSMRVGMRVVKRGCPECRTGDWGDQNVWVSLLQHIGMWRSRMVWMVSVLAGML